ncbi:uncharacterized protein V6R79_023267 [Siganus canaliculatus]
MERTSRVENPDTGSTEERTRARADTSPSGHGSGFRAQSSDLRTGLLRTGGLLKQQGNMGFLPLLSGETWILLVSFLCLFVLYGRWTHRTFDRLGIPGPKPVLYFGSICRFHKVYYQDDVACAKQYGRVWGSYELRKPMLFVTEPEMLKTILVKECFTHFTNRRNFRLNGDLYDAVNIAEDDNWRRIRNVLSPSFSSGRIKEMFILMKHHSHKLATCLQDKAQREEVVQIKDFCGFYAVDVMGSCAFSVDMDSFSSASNPFIPHVSKLFRFPIPLYFFQGCFPFFLPVLELLGVSFFSKTSLAFFKSSVEKIQGQRHGSSSQTSADILQHMICSQVTGETKEPNQRKGLSQHEIVSQVTMLMFAGYETSATTLSFLAYVLATNPDAMKQLQDEIDSTFPNKAPVQYEALMQMEYLDCVVNECLRLYPPAARLERVAKHTVEIHGVLIPKNMIVEVPVFALHRDPELWPKPQQFRPDRFSKENRQNIRPYSYLPFGVGPRNCVGMRFALTMVKLALVEVLQSCSFVVCQETEIPLTMDPEGLVGPVRPIQVKMAPR